MYIKKPEIPFPHATVINITRRQTEEQAEVKRDES